VATVHTFPLPGLQLAYDTAFDTLLATVDRRTRLDEAFAAMAADSTFTPVVTRLGCLRGVSTLTAFGLALRRRRHVGAALPDGRRYLKCAGRRLIENPWSPPPTSPNGSVRGAVRTTSARRATRDLGRARTGVAMNIVVASTLDTGE